MDDLELMYMSKLLHFLIRPCYSDVIVLVGGSLAIFRDPKKLDWRYFLILLTFMLLFKLFLYLLKFSKRASALGPIELKGWRLLGYIYSVTCVIVILYLGEYAVFSSEAHRWRIVFSVCVFAIALPIIVSRRIGRLSSSQK